MCERTRSREVRAEAQFLVFSSGVYAKSDPKSPGADMYAHWRTVYGLRLSLKSFGLTALFRKYSPDVRICVHKGLSKCFVVCCF